MAEFVQLVVKVDKTQLSNLQDEVKQLGGQTLKINADSSGVAAMQKGLHQLKEDTAGNTQELTKYNLELGKTKTIIEETGKASSKTTTIIRENYDEIRKAAQKTAADEAKYAGEAKKYLLEEAAAQKKVAEAAAAVPTKLQEQINAITGVSNSYKSAQESALLFEKELVNKRLGIDQETKALEAATRAYEQYAAAQNAAKANVVTPMQAQINALTGVSNGFKSAADSAAVFQMNGLTPLEKQLRNSEKAMDDVTGKSESLVSNITKFTKWYLIGNAVSGVVRALKDALSTMKEVDSELVTVRKVTGMVGQDLEELEDRAYRTASAYGKAAEDYLAFVSGFARAGYKEQSADLAELATKTQIVGDTTAEVAQQFLLSVDAAYHMEGSIKELSKVLDGANEIDNKYATSIEKIAEGLGSVAPVASQMHVSVAELTAAIGTITAVTQRSGNEAAKALRALFLNIVGDTKTEIEEGVTWTTGEIAGLRDVIKQYAPEAYKAAQATGAIIDPMEAIGGLAQSMKDGLLTEQELMSMVSDIGGKLRSSQLLALIQNWDMYQSMLVDYGNALGSADKEVENALNSWEVKTNQLKNSWTQLVATIVDTEAIKSALDGIISLLDTLNSKIGSRTTGNFPSFTTVDMQAWIDGYIMRLGATDEATVKFRENLEKSMRTAIDDYFEAVQAGEKLSEQHTQLIQTMMDMLGYYGKYTPAVEDNTEALEENADAEKGVASGAGKIGEAAKAAQTATDELEKSCKAVSTALKDFKEYGGLTTDAMTSLKEVLPDVVTALFDETGALTDAGKAAFETANNLDSTKAATEYLQIAAQQANYANLIAQIKAVGDQAVISTGEVAQMLATIYASSAVSTAQLRGLEQTAAAKGTTVQQELMNLLTANMRAATTAMGDIATSHTKPSGGGSSKSSSSSKSEKDAELERLKAIVNIREEEYNFLKESNAEQDAQFGKIREIQSALHDEAEYLRSTKDYQVAIAQAEKDSTKLTAEQISLLETVEGLSKTWWTWENKITDELEKQRKEREKAVEEAAKKEKDDFLDYVDRMKDALDKERDARLKPLQDQLDALKAQHDAVKQQREEQEKLLAVEKAREALENAKRQRTVRQYNAASGQWEWVANAKTVAAAQKSLEDAEKALRDYREEQLYQRQKAAIEQQIAATKEAFDAQKKAWEEAAKLVKSGAMSVAEAMQYAQSQISQAATAISNAASNAIVAATATAVYPGSGASGSSGGGSGYGTLGGYDITGYTDDGIPYVDAGTESTWSGGTPYSSKMPSMARNEALAGQTIASHGMYVTYNDQGYAVSARNMAWDSDKGSFDYSIKFDSGGLLKGLGGIKATRDDELILPPDVTKSVLSPALTSNVASRIEELGILTGARGVATNQNIQYGAKTTSISGDTIYINGIDLSSHVTKGTTLGELGGIARNLGLYSRS